MRIYKQVTGILLLLPLVATAQISADSALAIFRKMAEVYAHTPYLSFEMSYKSAAESDPAKTLDTMSGSVKMNGDVYAYTLGETENIHNAQYDMILFHENKLLYIKKPAMYVQNSPLAVLDSMLLKVKDIHIKATLVKGYIHLEIDFPPEYFYRTFELSIERSTWHLVHSRCIIKNQLLYGSGTENTGAGAEGWTIVESRYFNYQTGKFDNRVFSTGTYFIKDGKEYKPSPAYSQYKLFLGSPNL